MKIHDDRLAMSKKEDPFDKLVRDIMSSRECDYWEARKVAYDRVLANPRLLERD